MSAASPLPTALRCLAAWILCLVGGSGMLCAQESRANVVRTASNKESIAANSAPQAIPIGFRLDVDIYSDETKPPVAQFKTLFTEQLSIEWNSEQGKVTILDSQSQMLTLLNTNERKMTEIELSSLDSMLTELLARTKQAEIQESRPDSNSIVVADIAAQYRVKTSKPTLEIMAVRYADFADAATKIAAVFPPYKPPQLRLKLNQLLLDERLLPMELRLATRTNSGTHELTARMLKKDSLSEEDRKELQMIQGWKNQFTFVRATEFFGMK
ncbi:MAG: hypothetical protein MUD03_07445 [Pirellula sp.]|nr:hypothetical protein [Pirellula sp.]